MQTWDDAALGQALRDVGIGPGETLLVHGALFALGRHASRPMQEVPAAVLAGLRAAVGESGTLVAPTFNFDFCDGQAFDPERTPSKKMGVLNEHLRTRSDAHRSPHPMQSVAAVGRLAEDVTGRDTGSAYAEGGPFARLVELDARLVFVGAPFQAASLVHYAEEREAVPYRAWKTFTGPCVRSGRPEIASYQLFARDLARDARLHLQPLADLLHELGRHRVARLGAGRVQACGARDFVDVARAQLEKDPEWLLERR